MTAASPPPSQTRDEIPEPLEVDVVIEVPRGSFLKRGYTGHIDFVSPLPCPFNYGAVPNYLGLEGDLLDRSCSDRACPSVPGSASKRGARSP